MTDAARERLGQTGAVYVTLAAAQQYADASRLQIETARRELTEHLLDATRPESSAWESPEQWRFRRRSAGVDITARVVREGPLAVVVAISVREYHPRRGGTQ